MMQLTKQEIIKRNDRIIKMISEAKTVWISTDWHYVKFDKKTHDIYVRDEFDDIMKACNVIKPDDVWIYLGDLIDSEIQKSSYLDCIDTYVRTKKRILLLGNNDRYKSYSHWFQETAYAILLPDKQVVLSHCPILNYEKLNIHGHIHVGEPGYGSAGKYWGMYDVAPDNHVNAFTYPFKPVTLASMLKKKPKAFVQEADIPGKPYTRDLLKETVREYQILHAHYGKDGG